MNTDDRALADLIARLRKGPVWSNDEPIGSVVGEVNGATMNEAADRLEAFHAKPVVGEEDEPESDDFERGKDAGATYVMQSLAELCGVPWTIREGSETWDGDVWATMYGILEDARVVDPWDNSVAKHATLHEERAALQSPPPVVEEGRREEALAFLRQHVPNDAPLWNDDGHDLANVVSWMCEFAALSTPVAAQGDEVRDLWSLEQRLTDGEFFSDYDEDLRLLGVFRRHVATLKDSSHEG